MSLFIDQDKPDEEEVASRVIGRTPEKASAFIQEVADRKPKGTTIPRSPLKQGLNTVISIFGAIYFDLFIQQIFAIIIYDQCLGQDSNGMCGSCLSHQT